MRGSTAGETFGGLGRKVDKEPPPAEPSKRAPPPPPACGIKVGEGGKWETDNYQPPPAKKG